MNLFVRQRLKLFSFTLLCCLISKAEAQVPAPLITFDKSYTSDSVNYIPGGSPVTIAVPGGGPGTTVYYVLDLEPLPENASVYTEPLTLSEGPHALYARAVQGEFFSESSAAIHVDAAAPQTTFQINGIAAAAPEADGFIHTGLYSTMALLPSDPASGVDFTGFLIDIAPESCGDMGPAISTMPAGTCQNYVYSGPFSLPLGTHTVYYMSLDNVGNEEALNETRLLIGGEGVLSGTISTPDLPAGSTVTIAVSTDYFRNDAVSVFTFGAEGTGFNYNLTLPAYATYYIAAFAGVLQDGPPPGAPIGTYDNFAPLYIAPGSNLMGINFPIAVDTLPPSAAINSIADNEEIADLHAISGTASDNMGVDSLEAAAQDLTTGLWWSGHGGQIWVSTNVVPPFEYLDENFQGSPSAPAWTVITDTSAYGVFGWLSSHLATGHQYKIYLRAVDLTGNIQQPPATVNFTWTGPQGYVAPNYVPDLTGFALGTSSVAWAWQAVPGAIGYAVTSNDGMFLSSVTALTYVSTEPGPNSPGYICAAAYNIYGTGQRNCPPVPVNTLAATPGAPVFVSVSSYSFTMKWSSAGNPPGTMYELSGSMDNFQSGASTSIVVYSGMGDVYVTVSGLAPQTAYYVRVRAINGDYIPTQFSSTLSFTTLAAAPETPINITASYDPASKKVSVFWSPAVLGEPAASFNVYRAAEPLPDSFSLRGSTTNPYFEDADIYSTTFYYSITALNQDGVESARSGPYRLEIDIDPPGWIDELKVSSYSSADNSAVLVWTVPYDNAALGYYLVKGADFPIVDSNWDSAVVAGTAAATSPIGAVQYYGVTAYSTETLKFFAVKTFDAAGNSSLVSISAVLDLLPPSLSVTSPLQPDAPVMRPFAMHVEASDNHNIAKVDFLVDNALAKSVLVQAQNYSFNYNWSIGDYSDGNHVLSVKAYDQYGNADVKDFPVLISYVPPAAPVISQPVNNFAVAEPLVAVSGSAEPGTYVSIFVNDAFVTSAEADMFGYFYAAAVPLGGDGAVSVAAQAVDTRGAGPRSAGVPGVVDSGPPGAPVSLAAQPGAYGKVALTWSVPAGEIPAAYNVYRSSSEAALVEGAAASQALLAAGGIKALEFNDIPSPDGVYYYAAASVDAAVNISTLSNVVSALSDSQPPTAAISLPGRTPPLGAGSYRLEVAVSEVLSGAPYLLFTAIGGYPVQITLEPSSPYIWTGTLTVTQAMASGAGSFTFQGVDLTGNSGNMITAGAAIQLQTEGPVASVSFEPQAGPALKAGSYGLRLVLSHAAVAAPELSFSVNSGSRTVALSSTTDASYWSGVLAVDGATGEGPHNFSYSAQDSLGNTGLLLNGATYFIADTAATDAPASLHWANGAAGIINLTWSSPLGEKPGHYCVYRDNSLVTCSVTPKPDFSGAFSETPSGTTLEYKITALDAAGNESAASNTVLATPDNTPPAAPQGLSAVADGSAINIAWSAGDSETPVTFRLYRTTYTINSTAGLAYRNLVGATAADSPARDGVYHYRIAALDQPGNASALSNEATVSYDAAAPEINISGVADGGYYNGAVNPAFETVDLNLAASSALLNNSSFVSGSAVSAPGSYTLVVNASDALSHAASKTVNFVIDKTSPAITLGGVSAGGVYTAAVTPAISASDAYLSTITAVFNGSPYVIGTAITGSGSYVLEITAMDLAGNSSIYSAAFTMDLPPQKLTALTAVIEDGSALALSWAAYPGEVSVYKVFKDGVYAGPVNIGQTSFRDTAYSPAAAHVYEVAVVDFKGREGARARAEIPAVSFDLAGYGNYSGTAQALNKGFFDTVRFSVANNGAQALTAGPVSLTVGLEAPVSAPALTVQAGSSAEMAPVVYTSTSCAASVSARATITLPRGGDADISAVKNFTMAVRAPVEPIVEIYPEALVRGAYAKVKVKFNNRGSAPADIVTAILANNKTASSPAVAVSLKTQAGLVLSSGEVLQSTHDVSAAYLNGVQSYFARVEPGSSYVFDAIDLAVPSSAGVDLVITGGVYAMAYSLAYKSLQASPAFQTSMAQSAVAVIPYTAVVAPLKQVYDKGEQVVLTGSVRDSVSGLLLGNKAVRIIVSNKGFERYISTVTASDGAFRAVFNPAAGESGIYYLSASYPYAVSRLAQSSFSIVGFELGYADYKTTLAQNSSFTFDVPLINSGETTLNGLGVSFEEMSSGGVTIAAGNIPADIPAGTRNNLSVIITAASNASSSANFTLQLRESNGFKRTMPVDISVVPAQVIPKITPQAFEMGMLAGETRTQSVTVENIGFSTWTSVTITTPTLSWVKVQGPQELGDIAPGANVTLALLVQPPAGLSNGSYAQTPLAVFKSQNYADVPVSAGLVVTSVKHGNAAFTVMNADKYPADPSRWIGGADVTLSSLDIIGMSLKVKSDANGLARFENVPSGKYAYRAEAAGFQTASGMISIEPGLSRDINVFMPTSMVTYKWSVTPTTIQDKYDITLDMTYRTDVPAPALVANPQVIPLQMEGGQTVYTQYTITNKGLVSAFDLKITNFGDSAMTIESAISSISELKPGQTAVVPLKVTLAHASQHPGGSNADGYYRALCGNMPASAAVKVLAGDVPLGGGGQSVNDRAYGPGGWRVSDIVPYVAAKVTPAAKKICQISGLPRDPDYKHKPNLPPGLCPEPVAGMAHGQQSLGADWRLYYDSLLKGFYETTGWTIEDQPDGSIILTDDEGNEIQFVPKGLFDQELIGACGQYDDIPGYGVEIVYAGGNYSVAQKSGNSINFSRHGDKYKPDVIRDTNNTTLTYAYDAAGRATTITDIHGRTMSFVYDAQGRKTEVSDFAGRHIYLTYDGEGRLSAVTDIDGGVESYAYGADGRIATVTHASGAHEYTVYDSTGRIVLYNEDGDNNKKTYVYNDISSTTLMTDALGRQTLYEYWGYAGRSEIAKITSPEGSVVSYDYDGNFNKTKVKDALNRETGMTYSRYSNLLSVTDPAGNITTMRYGLGSAANNIAAATSNRYAASKGEAEAAGCSSGGAEGGGMVMLAIEENPYAPEKDGPYLTSVTDPKGNLTQMDYDLNGNLIEVKDAQGNVSNMSYDQQGHVTGTRDPLGHVSLFEYDHLGALAKVTDPLGRITQLTRDDLSRVTRTVDPANKLTLFDYDVKGNLTKVTDAIGGITEYGYTGGGCTSCGGAGELLGSVKDAKNQTTTFQYDLHKSLTEVKNPLNESKHFTYDKKKNLLSVTDAKGVTISFDYDVMDRLTVKHLPEGDVAYTYDVVGNLLSVTSPEGQLTFAYDALNRVTQTTQRFPLYASPYTLSYAYDANGNRTQMTSPWGTTSYTYDALNRLTSLTNPDAKTVTFAYDAAGKRTRMTYPNGTETTYAYDAASQLTQILHRKTEGNTAIAFANYNYDPAGNRTSMQDLAGTHSYGYDDLHRLITADHPSQSNLAVNNEVFNYDAVGNRLSDAVITNYQHNAANRLLENSSYTYTYDANGNLDGQTEKATNAHTTYEYNSENQMKQATMPDGTIATYKYDPLGRRIEKAVTVNSVPSTIYYRYDNEDIIAMLDGNNTGTANFTHGPGIDEPLIMKKVDGYSYYYHVDGLGSITALSDNTGAIVETMEYQAYGKPVFKDASGTIITKSALGNTYSYTSREYDDETGLYYSVVRYLDTKIGAFTQEDPIWPASGEKIYAYVDNNPINQVDPFGLQSCGKKECYSKCMQKYKGQYEFYEKISIPFSKIGLFAYSFDKVSKKIFVYALDAKSGNIKSFSAIDVAELYKGNPFRWEIVRGSFNFADLRYGFYRGASVAAKGLGYVGAGGFALGAGGQFGTFLLCEYECHGL